MAGRQPLIERKTKKIKLTKSELFLINQKYLGDEPIYVGDKFLTESQYGKALNWYNSMCTRQEGYDYLETYLKNTGRQADLKKIKTVPESMIPETIFWIARMYTCGAKLPEKSLDWFNTKLKESFLYAKQPTEETVKVNIQSKVEDKIDNFIGMFEVEIDKNGWSISMFDMLTKHQISPMHVSKVVAYFAPIAAEANELVGGRVFKAKVDKQLLEGFEHLTKDQVNQRAAFYNSILSDCERFINNGKAQRAPRKKKVVSPDKKLKNLSYTKECKEFKVVSVNPIKILGSKELWTFNVKYKTLTHMVALDRAGLDVKGTTIVNVDETASKTYRVGRKTETYLQAVLNNGKRELNKAVSELNVIDLQQRCNENTILLKVI